jgi:arylsulfatase A-like enzyme
MTPKEKAEELKEKFDGYICYAEAAVDEILDALDQSLIDADIEWWKQVKQELEKL